MINCSMTKEKVIGCIKFLYLEKKIDYKTYKTILRLLKDTKENKKMKGEKT